MSGLVDKRVVVTRAPHQALQLSQLLEQHGAQVVELPTIHIVDPDDGGSALRDALARSDEYAWLVVTSVNTVHRIAERVSNTFSKVAAIGPATADALAELGLRVDLVPERYVAEALVDAFPAGPGRVLLPRAEVAREVLPDGLRAKGWQVDVVVAYKTVNAGVAAAAETMSRADIVTFTASSTVNSFVETYGRPDPRVEVACIGPITAATARSHGMRVDVVADDHTIEGLVSALLQRRP